MTLDERQSEKDMTETLVIWQSGSRPTKALMRVFVLMGVNIFGNGLVMAYTLIYLTERRGIDLRTAGLITGLMGLVGIVSGPLFGALSDRFGPHRLLTGVFVFGAIGYASLGFASTTPLLAIAAALCGASGGWGATNSLVTTLTTKETRPRAFAIQRAVINASIGVGGLVGGFIANPKHPATFDALFALDVLTFLVAAVIVSRLGHMIPIHLLHPRNTRPLANVDRNQLGYRAVLRDRHFVRLLPYDLATGLTFSVAFDVLPAAIRKLNVSNGWIGVLFGINTTAVVLFQLPTVHLVSGRRRLPLLAGQQILFAVGFVVAISAGRGHGLVIIALFAVAMIVFSLGECLMGAVRSPMIADFASAELIGRYGALTQTVFMLGMALGRPIGTRALARSATTLWLFGVCIALIAGVFLLTTERSLPHQLRRAIGPEKSTPTVSPLS